MDSDESVDFECEWKLKDVCILREVWNESGISEIEKRNFSEADDWDYAWQRHEVEIELDVDLVREKDDDSIGPNLRL